MTKHRKTDHLITERINPRTIGIDKCSTLEIVELISEEDKEVAEAVSRQIRKITKSVNFIVSSLKQGGRLLFIGAGTSGRLGVMEATECPPTFGTDPNLIKGVIAGGKSAFWRSIEGAEDSRKDSQTELAKLKLNSKDVVVGIAASVDTPFVEGALSYAKKIGCGRIIITCHPVNYSNLADIIISPVVGPEVIVGSTRMKAGTATKMVLNMLTTATMIKLGKTYGNLMVDVQPRSEKLRDRAIRIVMHLAGTGRKETSILLERSRWNVKIAVIMGRKGIKYREARAILESSNGFLRKALK
ncbi:N-acetylmuramic acid 6-phosphate etherase [Desulfobacterota bacterium AH_259_B03_O07]|nr:N-acetylmuramic acid 6-phosphate etherase [Desulfobacterota bacterium AH_259_B03_O07]